MHLRVWVVRQATGGAVNLAPFRTALGLLSHIGTEPNVPWHGQNRRLKPVEVHARRIHRTFCDKELANGAVLGRFAKPRPKPRYGKCSPDGTSAWDLDVYCDEDLAILVTILGHFRHGRWLPPRWLGRGGCFKSAVPGVPTVRIAGTCAAASGRSVRCRADGVNCSPQAQHAA